MVDNCITMLTPTTDKEEDNMWDTGAKLSEDDKWMIDAWNDDANGILAFVSLNLLVRPPVYHINEKLKDGSSLRNYWCFYY